MDWPSERFERHARVTASYCVGMTRLIAGDEEAARAAFERCLELELPWVWAHASARARLAELR